MRFPAISVSVVLGLSLLSDVVVAFSLPIAETQQKQFSLGFRPRNTVISSSSFQGTSSIRRRRIETITMEMSHPGKEEEEPSFSEVPITWRESSPSASSATPSSSLSSFYEYDDFLPQPGPHLDASDVVQACMETFLRHRDAGLEVCFHFSSDKCRAAQGGSLEEFYHYAKNPVFGYLSNCVGYEIVRIGPVIQGTPTRGAMQTVLMDTTQQQPTNQPGRGGNRKRFLWTLQQERRPPRQGFWLIHEVMYTENAYQMTI